MFLPTCKVAAMNINVRNGRKAMKIFRLFYQRESLLSDFCNITLSRITFKIHEKVCTAIIVN